MDATQKEQVMVSCEHGDCTFAIQSKDADSVLLCGDCIACFQMTRQGRDLWVVTLQLPVGHHYFRYYGQYGRTTLWQGADEVVIQSQIVHDDSQLRYD
ncbi:MAG: hypothetical protein WD042_18910 [Phycisphaeraceae bacterium]